MALRYDKSISSAAAEYARGGPGDTSRSRFYKDYPDVFRTSIERQDYGKSSPGGEMAETKGDTKSKTPIKPRT
jgi:hypothetical protein